MTTLCFQMFARQNKVAKKEVSGKGSNNINEQDDQSNNIKEIQGKKEQI